MRCPSSFLQPGLRWPSGAVRSSCGSWYSSTPCALGSQFICINYVSNSSKVGSTYLQHSMTASCCCSVTQSCLTLCNPMDYSTPCFPVHYHLLELAQTYVHWVGDAIQPSHPLTSPSPPAFNLTQHQGLFQWVGSLHQVAEYWSLTSSISSSSEYSGLISFRMDWFDFLAVQETLKSLRQQSINSLVLSLLYGPTLTSIHAYWKNHSFD